jgi:hypothetical protein
MTRNSEHSQHTGWWASLRRRLPDPTGQYTAAVLLVLVLAAPRLADPASSLGRGAAGITGSVAAWLYWSGVIYAGSLLLGGRTTGKTAFRAVLLGWTPFALRAATQAIYLLAGGGELVNPGLSGFAPVLDSTTLTLLLRHLLAHLDFYQIASLYLLVRGGAAAANLPPKRMVGLVAAGFAGAVLLSALPALAGSAVSMLMDNWI